MKNYFRTILLSIFLLPLSCDNNSNKKDAKSENPSSSSMMSTSESPAMSFDKTLHDFGTKSVGDIERELKKFSKERKMELILPSLYSELEGDALPKIVNEISKTNYLNHIIIGLDRANKSQAQKDWKFFKAFINIQ